ncbi:hypothetical protein LWI28_010197 [Acer negundo]|nr:hypothetical protein LWI28_010197 [Acer negundo]
MASISRDMKTLMDNLEKPPLVANQVCNREEHGMDMYTMAKSMPLKEEEGQADIMSGTEDVREQEIVDSNATEESQKMMPSSEEQEATLKKKYGGMVPKKPPLISKDHERAYFDSADWALGKQGVDKPKGPLEALRPKLQPTQQQTRYRKSPYAPSGEDGGSAPAEDASGNE